MTRDRSDTQARSRREPAGRSRHVVGGAWRRALSSTPQQVTPHSPLEPLTSAGKKTAGDGRATERHVLQGEWKRERSES
jgi:hypothetical protein